MITEKILVVDDEETVCQSIKKILSRKGYTVDNALNVEDAVKKMQHTPFDVVITDLMMPKTSGMELMQIIQDHYPELEVIMITGYASIDSAVKATKFGASYLQKPFTPDELMILTEQAVVSRKAKLIQTLEQRKPTTMPSEQIDVDMPFNKMEVERSTSKEFVESLTHSDVPIAKKSADKAYCYTGKRDCRRVIVEGRECPGECPIEKKEKARAKAAGKTTSSTVELIDADMPFDVSEVGKYMSTDYVNCLDRSDIPRAALFGRDASLKYSVLVIDDEPIVCHSVRRILTKKSCAVEEAFDVDAALQKLQLNQYDLVIVDLKMPKRTGMEILESIRTNYPDTPVVMVTGFASIDTAIQATKAGAFNFIPKPFTPEELSKVAEEALA
jgi:DNA-binding NtrC family response regulator